jgi:SAM-dependent methyltransferase
VRRTSLYSLGGAPVDFYDRLHAPGRVPAIAGDVEFYRRWARRTGGPVLELACGTGRVAIPIARDGRQIVGLDLSPHMLRLARAKAGGLRATFVRGTMRRFDLGRKFRLILIPFRSFQAMLTSAEQRDCLGCVRRHLAPGGLAIVNVFDPRLEYCVHGRSRVLSRYRTACDPATGRTIRIVVRERSNDALRQLLTERWECVVRDRRGRVVERSVRTLTIRWTYRWEMRHLLELCGLEPVACFGDFREGPPAYGREQIWVVRAGRKK